MAEQDSTTKSPQEERKTYQNLLSDAIGLIRHPLKDFIGLVNDETEGKTGRIMRVLQELLERQDQEFKKIYEAIDRTLGRLSLEYPLPIKWVEYPEIIRAVLEPVKRPAAPEGGE